MEKFCVELPRPVLWAPRRGSHKDASGKPITSPDIGGSCGASEQDHTTAEIPGRAGPTRQAWETAVTLTARGPTPAPRAAQSRRHKRWL